MAEEYRWWQRGVVYQIYPRSFQDSNGDGVGDLPGITRAARLPRAAGRGRHLDLARSIPRRWPTSATTSPTTRDVDPLFGTLADFDALLAAAHARGLQVILDFVPEPHLRPAPLVPGVARLARQPEARLVPLARPGARRRPAQQLAEQLRRQRLGMGRGHRPVLPALLREGAARPQLAQPGRAGGHVRRDALLARPRRGRLPRRRDAGMLKDAQLRDNPPNPDWRAGHRPAIAPNCRSTRATGPTSHPIIAAMRRVAGRLPRRPRADRRDLPAQRATDGATTARSWTRRTCRSTSS